jgi:NADPH:quinone reductase-like Zn-dependent oxidoreductase
VSGTGSYAIQLAKNVYGAKVITTVSTAKVPLIKELLGENTIDESQSSSQAR